MKHMTDTTELIDKNLILIYGPTQSGKSTTARYILKELGIEEPKMNGKEIFKIDQKGKKEMEYHAVNDVDNTNDEYVVELHSDNNSSPLYKLENSLNL